MRHFQWLILGSTLMMTGSCLRRPDPFPNLMGAPTAEESLTSFLNDFYDTELETDPVGQHYQGITHQQDRWSLWTEEYQQARLQRATSKLGNMKAQFNLDTLRPQSKLNYTLFSERVKNHNEAYQWRDYGYAFTQMHGTHAWIPSFLINVHQIKNEKDALAYIDRLQGVKEVIDLAIRQMKRSHSKDILPPAFVFPMVIEDSRNLLKGAPFETGQPGPWLKDFEDKVNVVDVFTQVEKEDLIAKASSAILEDVGPAYRTLIQELEALALVATSDDGVWKFPNGDAYYDFKLRQTTTTNLTADEIHSIGLSEVARIHQEMRSIQLDVGFQGSLQNFFVHLRSDRKFYYPNDPQGQADYLKDAQSIIEKMENALPGYFLTKPLARLKVKAVEPYREKSAGKAFYSRGTPNGSRPGVYYANLYDMNSMPKYQMEALAYHEGIPGHHLQNSIAQEIDGIAKFRKFSGYTAYGEGWGLYSEYLPKEMGFYKDPYSDFGRLAMELWRACRLVVDTGIHRKRWTRDQAVDYLMENTPNPRADAVKAIERYIVMPGQATGYKIGMIKILELRQRAKTELGTHFRLSEFHEVVLTNGPVPLHVLASLVDQWIEEKKPKDNP